MRASSTMRHFELATGRRTTACTADSIVSPDGRHLYFVSDRGFADEPSEAARSARDGNARLDGPGNGLGDTWRVPTSAGLGAPGRTPR